MNSRSDRLEHEALEHLMRATSGHARVADLKALEAWRSESVAHAHAYRRAMQTWSSIGSAATEAATAQDRAMIVDRGRSAPATISRRALVAGGGFATAAALGAALVVRPPFELWPSLLELTADYRTAPGERREIALADGISLELNTRTSVVNRPAAGGPARIELLSGEALIRTELQAANPLTVTASDLVLVTARSQFNLRNDANGARVTCLDGVVRVECRGAVASLRAGEQLVYGGGHLGAPSDVDAASVTAWRSGLLLFHDEPLSGVVAEANRYWPGRIVLLNRDLGRRRLTVRIELARIDEIITIIHDVLGAGVRRLPGDIVLLT